MNSEKKKLIVVANGKYSVYGELLSALVSIDDDEYDAETKAIKEVVGTVDGTVDVIVWDEKTYHDNQPKLGSNNKIVFIGKSKVSKPIMPNINFNCELSKFGVNYGSLGNKAMIYVKPRIIKKNKDLYNEFLNNYIRFIISIGEGYSEERLVKKDFDIKTEYKEKAKKPLSFVNVPIKFVKNLFTGKLKINSNGELIADENNKKKEIVVQDQVNISIPYFWPTEIVEIVEKGLVKAKKRRQIRNQQYRFGILMFYINRLAKFMGN